ncbi:MAG: T9SS type A sorting domain-containing protein [Candidatus Kerfeldbacteria bacterium]|nr:T9SS type A sorting domain-containing protein [Candidatus Kerfeldbacteria bacterium]
MHVSVIEVFYGDFDGATRFSVDSLGLGPNDSQVVSALWYAAAPDTHVITVSVSPFSVPTESDYDNNSVSKTIILGQHITGVEDQGNELRFGLGPILPNPSRGTAEFRFSTPFHAPVRLTIYDVQGRRIKQWQWEGLPAGAHALQWNGTTDHGQIAPAGMLFVRLVSNGRVATSKLVRLR